MDMWGRNILYESVRKIVGKNENIAFGRWKQLSTEDKSYKFNEIF
jgi:hypothetical protein